MTTAARVRFVDVARAVAVLFMIQGHTIQALLAPAYQEHVAFDIWLYFRGLTSCAFLTLSGFSFSLATDRHWSDYARPTKRLGRRFARYGLLLVLGYALHIPVRPLSGLCTASADQWRFFATVDILQLVAVTLTVLQVAVWLLRIRRRVELAAWCGAAAVVLVSPLASTVDRHSALPFWAVAYLSGAEGSLFPAFPWAAYMLLGAALGLWFVRAGRGAAPAALEIPRTTRLRLPTMATSPGGVLLVSGGTMLVGGIALDLVPLTPFGTIDFWKVSPNLFLIKAASVLIILSAVARLVPGHGALPPLVTVVSSESLTVYLWHLAVLYGSIWNRGLVHAIGPRLHYLGVALWALAVAAAMALLAWLWSHCKRHYPRLAMLIRLGLAGALIGLLL